MRPAETFDNTLNLREGIIMLAVVHFINPADQDHASSNESRSGAFRFAVRMSGTVINWITPNGPQRRPRAIGVICKQNGRAGSAACGG